VGKKKLFLICPYIPDFANENTNERGTAWRETRMKLAFEILSETFAAAAAILWFMSARVRLRRRGHARRGLETGLDDPRLLLRLVYEQSQWSAWAAIAAGLAAIFAIADGLAR
jgi:hypothetical protein